MSTLQSALLAKYGELLAEFEHRVVWVSDVKTNEMLYMNRMAKVLIGIEEDDEYLGKPCYQVLHGNNRPCTFCPNCKNVSDNHYCWTQYNVRAHKWLIIDDHLITVDDHTCRMEIAKELLPNEMGQINSENILLQSIQTLTANKDFHSAIDTFLEMVGGFYFADRTYVFELDFENGVTNNIFEWCDIGVEPQIDLLQNVPINEVDEWIASFLQNKEYVIRSLEDDLDHDSDTYKRLAPQQITALLVAPIFIEEKLFGFIGVDNPELQLDNINLLRAATDVIAVEIDKQRMLERLEYLSYTDILTGTYNRNRYIRELHERYHNPPQTLGVIIADINGLKGLNDRYGHKYGDSIIVRTAQILKENTPYPVFRIGGDEFIVPCPEIGKAAFEELVQALRNAFAREPECSVCIGNSWEGNTLDIDKQITRADELLYAEKQSYYHETSRDIKITRHGAIQELLEEIEAQRFCIYFQPKIDLNSKKIVGAEALVRKIDADGKLILPSKFIPFYESQGILMHLDRYVFKSALQAIKTLEKFGLRTRISVNFSRSTLLMPNFVDHILAEFEQFDVERDRVIFEVTETISKIGRETLDDLLRRIRTAGIQLSLDDFGSQYSNLAMITDMGFEEIKLDRSLIHNICENQRTRIVVRTILQMCRELGNISVVAEGIEKAAQADLLGELGCDIGQGYYFHRLVSLDELVALLKSEE